MQKLVNAESFFDVSCENMHTFCPLLTRPQIKHYHENEQTNENNHVPRRGDGISDSRSWNG